jgi:5-methylcytosine-specific restriction endonuclease McrBC regulatory subunit McrC
MSSPSLIIVRAVRHTAVRFDTAIFSILPEVKNYYEAFLSDYIKHVESVNQVLSVLNNVFRNL